MTTIPNTIIQTGKHKSDINKHSLKWQIQNPEFNYIFFDDEDCREFIGTHFAQEVVEECASFPHGDHDDYVDSMTQALMRIRQGGLIPHPEDYKPEPIVKGNLKYYG